MEDGDKPKRFRTKEPGEGHFRWLTQSLFYETSDVPDNIIYTLKGDDFKGFPSLKRLYLETSDLTEYEFATTHLGGWHHWQTLCKSPFFQTYLAEWRTELELKLKAMALRNIVDEAKGGEKNSFSANKFLVARGWIDKETEPNRRGRPSKEEISRKAEEIAFEDKQIQEDLERLGICPDSPSSRIN